MSVTLLYLNLECIVNGTPTSTQYVYYTDGVTLIRKGVRDSAFVVDIALTPTGFSGDEDTDWICIRTIE